MIRRTWTPLITPIEDTSSLIVYDFGDYIGELYGDEWKCWRILKRVSFADGRIEEDLESMPDDWVPKEVVSMQEYAYTPSENQLTGWQRSEQAMHLPQLPQLPQLQKPSQKQQQPHRHQENRGESKKPHHIHRAHHHHKVGKEPVRNQ